MGAQTSKLSPEELQELQDSSNFKAAEIQQLFERFTKLDRNQDGLLTTAEFQLIPELSMNPLCHRIIALFDTDGSDQVNFKRFVQTLSLFHPDATHAQKLTVLFRVYDVDGDGLISEADLFHVLKMLVGSYLEDAKLQKIVKKTISEADPKQQGKITMDIFSKILGDASSLTIAL